jgi:hypothetical protein
MTRELSRTVSPGLDLGELVVVHRGAGERGHGLALRAGDQDAELVGRSVLNLVQDG